MSGWDTHEKEQAVRMQSALPEERLRWLEQAKRFAAEFAGSAQRQGAQVSSAGAGNRYAWGDGCEGWRLLDLPSFSVVLERMPAHTRECRHRHGKARQYFFVLRGTLTIELEGQEREVGEQCGFEIAPSLAHEVRNDSEDATDFLVISVPSVAEDRIPAPVRRT